MDIPYPGLKVLHKAILETQGFRHEAQAYFFDLILRCLINRILIRKDVAAHPKILEERILRPMVVTGLPRSGTTAMQRILTADPRCRHLPFWEACRPSLGRAPGDRSEDPRIEACQKEIESLAPSREAYQKIHYTAVDSSEECRVLFQNSLISQAFHSMGFLPSYHEWMEKNIWRAYRFHKI